MAKASGLNVYKQNFFGNEHLFANNALNLIFFQYVAHEYLK